MRFVCPPADPLSQTSRYFVMVAQQYPDLVFPYTVTTTPSTAVHPELQDLDLEGTTLDALGASSTPLRYTIAHVSLDTHVDNAKADDPLRTRYYELAQTGTGLDLC